MTPQEKLQQLGITLPPVSAPAAAYVPFVRTGNLVFLSGHIARKDGCAWVGKLGDTLETAEGKLAVGDVFLDTTPEKVIVAAPRRGQQEGALRP